MRENKVKTLLTKKFAIISNVMLPSQANAYGNVHGGEIMKMMDSAAACAATKYSRSMAVTARVEELNFHKPVYVGQLLTCIAEVVYTGRSSMMVYVRVEIEDMNEEDSRTTALTGLFTMVAIDERRKPKAIKPMEQPEDEEELELYEMGKERYLLNKSTILKK